MRPAVISAFIRFEEVKALYESCFDANQKIILDYQLFG